MPQKSNHKRSQLALSFFKLFWNNLFLAFGAFLAIALLLSGFFFWQYFMNPGKLIQQKESGNSSIIVNQGLFDQFSKEWEAREKTFNEVANSQYQDPFSGVFEGGPGILEPWASSSEEFL